MASFSALLLLALPALAVASAGGRGVEGRQRESSLVQTWGEALDGAHSTATPVTRVVNLLKEMKETLSKEMEEDEALYDKLACWCNNNQYEKGNAISEGEAKIKELTSTIEEATAKKAELETTIKQLEEDVATNKKALAEATAMREKEAKAFHGMELDSIQAVENLKAAIMVLGRHHGSAFPQISLNLLQESTGEKRASDIPWSSYHESRMERTFDQFLGDNDFEAASGKVVEPHKFCSSPSRRTLRRLSPDHTLGADDIIGNNDRNLTATKMAAKNTCQTEAALKTSSVRAAQTRRSSRSSKKSKAARNMKRTSRRKRSQ